MNRSSYIRRTRIFAEFGENSSMSSRKIPLYPELISIGNNVRLAANVTLITHDMIHAMLNNRNNVDFQKRGETADYKEYMGCIKIDDNVFVGANSTILADVYIGSNTIIGACSLVNKDLEGGFVYAGVPVRKICTFDEFVSKRRLNNSYPAQLGRIGDSVEKELAEFLWKRFYDNRSNELKKGQ